MTRKERKSPLCRRFGYVTLFIITLGELLPSISVRNQGLKFRSYIKHSRERFIRYANTSRLVKNLGCAPFFQLTSQLMFEYLMKGSCLCFIHYLSTTLCV